MRVDQCIAVICVFMLGGCVGFTPARSFTGIGTAGRIAGPGFAEELSGDWYLLSTASRAQIPVRIEPDRSGAWHVEVINRTSRDLILNIVEHGSQRYFDLRQAPDLEDSAEMHDFSIERLRIPVYYLGTIDWSGRSLVARCVAAPVFPDRDSVESVERRGMVLLTLGTDRSGSPSLQRYEGPAANGEGLAKVLGSVIVLGGTANAVREFVIDASGAGRFTEVPLVLTRDRVGLPPAWSRRELEQTLSAYDPWLGEKLSAIQDQEIRP